MSVQVNLAAQPVYTRTYCTDTMKRITEEDRTGIVELFAAIYYSRFGASTCTLCSYTALAFGFPFSIREHTYRYERNFIYHQYKRAR